MKSEEQMMHSDAGTPDDSRVASDAGQTPAAVEEISTEALIASVGAAVRAARTRRGVTRKNLARHASISERYLTELEAGRANASLSVIHRVSQALGLTISELIPGRSSSVDEITARIESLQPERQQRVLALLGSAATAAQPERPCGVALVGLRGAGKSTLGSELARKNGVEFIRLRQVIEQLGGQQLGELVSLAGQRPYRRLEKQALLETIAGCAVDDTGHRTAPVVLEVGGSLVTEKSTYDILLNHFYTVWVRAEPDDHLQRVIEQGDRRPMAGSRDAIQDISIMLSERENDYMRAHSQISTHGKTSQTCTALLDANCKDWLKAR